jgi:hypothetical protein
MERIELGQQKAGDVGSTCGPSANHGSDHIYFVIQVLNFDEMVIADNQQTAPHFRFAGGKGGKILTKFFLRRVSHQMSGLSKLSKQQFFSLSLLILIGLIVLPRAARCQNFQVDRIDICSNELSDASTSCNVVRPPYENLSRRQFNIEQIYVRLVIRCNQACIDFIVKNEGVLPIKVAVWKDGISHNYNDKNIGIGQANWNTDGAKFLATAAADGSFAWRTFFYVSLGSFQSLEFAISDAFDTALLLNGSPRFQLHISR